MSDIRCQSARKWMQAASELHPLDARRLDRHLSSCAKCTAYRRGQYETDRLIESALTTAVGGRSVRAEMRALLLADGQRTPAGQRVRDRKRGVWRLPLSRKPSLRKAVAWISVPVAAAVVATAVFLSQLGGSIGPGVTPVVGASWNVVRPDIAFPMTVDPTRPDHLLAGAMGQVYESWNAGNSWHPLAPLPAGLAVRDLAVDAAHSNHYLVAMNHSVYVSTDAGRHWKAGLRLIPGAFNMFVMQQPRSPSTWYLGPSVLWKSADGGVTWGRAQGTRIFSPYGIETLAIAPNGDLYTGIWGGGVAVSQNGGISWQRRMNGLAPHVLDVFFRSGRLWAATDRGVYLSLDRGLHWKHVGPHSHFYTTSILDAGTYQVAAGIGGIFRSDDRGKTWHVATRGLPFYSYIYTLVADPWHPNRVYACLNTDGIFRSDDAGRTWARMDSGLPLSGGQYAPTSVLLKRHGVLWITDETGADPHNLTIDSRVSVAVTTPDGAAVAYVSGTQDGWAARIVSGGGSAATTIATGSGPAPTQIVWSPGSSSLAMSGGSTIWVNDRLHGTSQWSIPDAERLVGWSGDGKSLLFWNSDSGSIVRRDPRAGRGLAGEISGTFPAVPVLAPDSRHMAVVTRRQLEIGTWTRLRRGQTAVAPGCSIGAWSADSTRLLLRCPGHVELRALSGALIARPNLPANAFFAPAADTHLLYFRNGLRRWTPGNHRTLIVPGARSVQPRP